MRSGERRSGYEKYIEIHSGVEEPDTKTVAKEIGVPPSTVSKWRRSIDHRKIVFSQKPVIEEGKVIFKPIT